MPNLLQNTLPSAATIVLPEATLHINSIMLQPTFGWRDDLKADKTVRQTYYIQGRTEINGLLRNVNVYINASDEDGNQMDLGEDEHGVSLLATNPDGTLIKSFKSPAAGFEALKCQTYGTDGMALLDAEGNVQYIEPEIPGFDMAIGTLALVKQNKSLTLKLVGVTATPLVEGNMGHDGLPYVKLGYSGLEVVPSLFTNRNTCGRVIPRGSKGHVSRAACANSAAVEQTI